LDEVVQEIQMVSIDIGDWEDESRDRTRRFDRKEKSKAFKAETQFKGKCHECGESGYWKRNCPKLKDKSRDKRQSAWSAVKTSKTPCYCGNNKCVPRALDSGASWHLDPNEEFFTGLRDHEGTQIETSNGDIIKANQVGTLKARLLGNQDDISISMEDTFYVPELPMGLISIDRLTDKGIQVNFKHEKAIITDRDGSILYEAHKRDGVHIIHMEHTGEY